MFDLARFFRLARAHWAEYRRPYAWFLGIGVIVHFVLMLVVLSGRDGYQSLTQDGQSSFYFMGLMLTGPLFAARYFQAMARRESAGLLLMRPASTFEKWLLAVVVVALLYPLAYTLAFYVCNAPAALYAQAASAQVGTGATPGPEARALQVFGATYGVLAPWHLFGGPRAFVGFVLALAIFQAFAVLGSLYFKSFPALKTVVAAFVLMLFFIFVDAVGGGESGPFLSYWIRELDLVPWQRWLFAFAWFAIPGMLWLACLFALREREVA